MTGSRPVAGSRGNTSSNCLQKARSGRSVLLVAPTGAGKTLAGFLPSLVELSETAPGKGNAGARKRPALHTLYISPLKALATDIARNLETPVREMDLPIRIETRTGDTPSHKRARQIEKPPDILLTTPEQLALLLAHREGRELFGGLRRVVLDELHSLVTSKRGDLLSLGLARLFVIAPQMTTVGLSATVREPDDLRRYLVPQRDQAGIVRPRDDRGRRRTGYPHAGNRRQTSARRAHRLAVDAIHLRSHPRSTGRRWSSSTRGSRPSTPFRSCGSSTTMAWRSRSTMAPSTCRSGGGSRRR